MYYLENSDIKFRSSILPHWHRVITVDTDAVGMTDIGLDGQMGFNLLPRVDVKHIFDIVSCNELTFLGF